MKLKQERSKEELAIPVYNKELAMKLQQSEREVLQLKLLNRRNGVFKSNQQFMYI
jgi:hypothetical protein